MKPKPTVQSQATDRGNKQGPIAGELIVGQRGREEPPLLVLDDFLTDDDEGHTLIHKEVPAATQVPPPAPPSSKTIAMAGRSGLPESETLRDAFADDARLAAASYQRELNGEQDEARIGRLHYEIARLCEGPLADPERAAEHYEKALAATPDSIAVVVSARRLMLVRGQFEPAIELFDRQIRVTANRAGKAALMFAKARVLEDHLDRAASAREIYAAAAELSQSDPVVLKALEQTDNRLRDYVKLGDDYARSANAVESDLRHRAALITRRARLAEVHGDDPDGSAELYQAALRVDNDAGGALSALKRLHYERRRWRELIEVLNREADSAQDPVVQTMALYRIGHILSERLGNRSEAIAVLERAAKVLPQQVNVLDALARLYEQSDAPADLAATLARLVDNTSEPHERLGYLHRIGELCRDALHDDEAAIRAYEAALEIDASYIPALRALAPMYAARDAWDDLVKMHEAEAKHVMDTGRRAVAHARAGEILQRIGRPTEAIAHHEHALALDVRLGSSFRALVRLYTELTEHHKLVELYERSLDQVDNERRIEYLFSIGDLYRGPLGDPEQAEYAYKRILKIDPKHLGAIHALQRVAESSNRYTQLVEALEREALLISDEVEIVALLHRAGEIQHEQLGDRAGAVRKFNRVLELDGRHVATLASLGRIYHAEGQWPDLVDIYRRELDVTPSGAAAVALLHKMGDVYTRYLADSDRACASYRKALDLDPLHRPSAHALARILRERGAWSELVTLIEQERDSFHDPAGRAMAAFQAGEIYEDHLDRRAEAERCYQQSLDLRPGYRPAADALARVRTHLAHWTELADELEQDAATATEPNLAIAALMRAGEVAADHIGSAPRAIACYERVLERDSEHIGALLAIEPLYRELGKFDALSRIYARQVVVFEDSGAKAASVSERARVLELSGKGESDDLVDCYTAMLAIRPNDAGALAGLERHALASRDPRVLASVDARLAAATSDPLLKGAYLTRQAESLEIAGQPQALEVYRQALSLDGESRAALRGLARLAEVLGDGPAMVEAARRSARVAREPAEAADAWVRSGRVHLETLADESAAVGDFEQALSVWPDHVAAAEELCRLLRSQGQHEILVERLVRAAGEAQDPTRQANLWIEAGRIYAKDLGNLGGALSVLGRLTASQPKNPHGLLELGRLLLSDRRAEEAIALFQRCLGLKPGTEVSQAAQANLARSYDTLGDAEAAFRAYEKALELAPDDAKLLERVFDLQMRGEQYSAASASAGRLLALAQTDESRVDAAIRLAQSRAGADETAEAVDALAQAVLIEGPGGRAAAQLGQIASAPAHWGRYVEALQGFLSQRATSAVKPGLYLEVARVQNERLQAGDDALSTLLEGLKVCEGDSGLRFELGKRLRAAGRLSESLEQLQVLLMDDVVRPEAWHYVAQAYDELGQSRERVMAIAVLNLLDDASAQEMELLRQWRPATRSIPPNSFAPGSVSELFVAGVQQRTASRLLASMTEGLGKVRAPDLAPYGVAGRDKLPPRSEHPVRILVDHLASVFGIEELDVYIHRRHERGVAVENTSRPSLLLPLWLIELPTSKQVFLITRLLFNLARGIQAIDMFTPRELEVLMAAAARTAVPSYGEQLASRELLEDRHKMIVRGLPRRKRKAFEAAAEAYARGQALDVSTFVQWAQQTARRIAVVVADDLIGSIEALGHVEDFRGQRGAALVRSSPIVADLLKVWVSKPAMGIRARCGLLPQHSQSQPIERNA